MMNRISRFYQQVFPKLSKAYKCAWLLPQI